MYQLNPNKHIIRFTYDDGGFRYKKEHFNLSTGEVEETTLYVRDASGQVASIYDLNLSSSVYKQEEIPFYGNSRIGTFINGNEYHYELKDHLGNVRETIKVISSTPTWADSKSDYYPFGMKFLNVNSYRYGYQGEYAEDETEENGIKANSFQLRLYNPRLGRWMSPDPKHEFHSPYLAMGNNPLSKIDPDGGHTETTVVTANDDGTYTVVDWIPDGKTDVVLEDGTKVGESLTTHSFVDEQNRAIIGAIIDLSSNEGQKYIDDEIIGADPSVVKYMLNAGYDGDLNFKCRGDDKYGNDEWHLKHIHRYRGSVTKDGKIASARDFGNMSAGIVAGRALIHYDLARAVMDWYNGKPEPLTTVKAQKIGFKIGSDLHFQDLMTTDKFENWIK